MTTRQKLFRDRLPLEQLVSLKCVAMGERADVSYQRSKGLSWSLTWAAARLAGEDPCVRQRWKSSQHRSGVQLGRHLQRSVVQPVSESRARFEVTKPLRAPMNI